MPSDESIENSFSVKLTRATWTPSTSINNILLSLYPLKSKYLILDDSKIEQVSIMP